MTIYKKLTQLEIDNLQPGTKINFGNGDVGEIIRFYDGERYCAIRDGKFTEYTEKMVEVKCSNNEISNFYTMVLKGATIESLDPTIELCKYCYNLRPASEMITASIWVNGDKQTNRYCSDKNCANFDQMAAEG